MATTEEKLQRYRDVLAECYHEFCDETQVYIDKELKEVDE